MFRISSIIIFLLFTSSFLPTTAYAKKDEKIPSLSIKNNSGSEEKNYREGEVIVVYKKDTAKEFQSLTKKDADPDKRNGKIVQSFKDSTKIDDLQLKEHKDDLGASLISSESTSTEDLIKEIQQDERVDYAEPNYLRSLAFIPNDPYFNTYQWALDLNDPDEDTDIDAPEAWDDENSSATNVTVAIIDSGINYNISELSENMWNGSTGCKSHTNTSIACPYHGWDFTDYDNNPDDTSTSIEDYQGHGTHVASIVGARTNNASGMSGISRYNHVKIMALRFDLDTFSEVDAINFARYNGAKVINASFAGSGYSAYEKNAIDNFPGIIVAAAGNDGSNNDSSPIYPCNYTSSNVICVAASDDSGNLASFSNYGATSVDIAAPGTDILGIQNDGVYYYGGGTSFAAPIVAGSIALFYSHRPTASIASIRNVLLQNGDYDSSLNWTTFSHRRLNLHNSLQAAIDLPFSSGAISVYRFWSNTKQGHFYTASEAEKDHVIDAYDDDVWKYEGSDFNAYASSINGATPIYRFWSNTKQGHFYTASEAEKDHVIDAYDDDVWKYEGIAYYAHVSQISNSTPIYRFWSNTKQGHFYTASEAEKDHVIDAYDDDVWKYEGIGWYTPL